MSWKRGGGAGVAMSFLQSEGGAARRLRPRNRMTRIRAIIFAIAVAVLVGGGFAGWRAYDTRTAWRSSVPAMPDLANWPTAFRERITSSTQRAAQRDAAALGELSRLYHANGFSREAAQCLTGLERFDSANSRWPHLHAHLVAGMGRFDEALPRWKRVVALAPDYLPARVRLGDVLLKTNRPEEATAAYADALTRAPEDPFALLGLARCELQLGRMTAARERLRQAVAARPDFGAGWNLLATIYERLGNNDGAVAAQERARDLRRFREMPDPWIDELLHECYDVYRLRVAAAAIAAGGEPRDALRWLARAAELSPHDAAVHRDLGDAWATMRDFTAARVAFERAIALEPNAEAGYLRLAALGTTSGDHELAARTFANGVMQCPASAALWFAHGRLLADADRPGEALAAFEQACQLAPDKLDAYMEIATLHFQKGRDREGLAALETAVEQVPEHLPALHSLARRAIELGDESAAERWLTRARARSSGQDARWADLAEQFQQRFGRAP
jgi:tetratricopeptide (TPR) repeat protein